MSQNGKDANYISPLDRVQVAKKLQQYLDSQAGSTELMLRQRELIKAQTSIAQGLHTLVGHDVVILYGGYAHVPYFRPDGARAGYDVMPAYDLDAALLEVELKCQPKGDGA